MNQILLCSSQCQGSCEMENANSKGKAVFPRNTLIPEGACGNLLSTETKNIGIAIKFSLWKHHANPKTANITYRVWGLFNLHFPKVLEQRQLLLILSSMPSSSSENGDVSAWARSTRWCPWRELSSQSCQRLLTWQEVRELFHSCESLVFSCSPNNVPAWPIPSACLWITELGWMFPEESHRSSPTQPLTSPAHFSSWLGIFS